MSTNAKSSNRYREHQNLVKNIKLAICSRIKGARVFDHTVGLFTASHGGKVKIGVNGMSDLFCLLPTDCGLMYIAIECKTGKAVQNKDQINWQKMIERMGGIYILAREVDSTIEKLEHYLRDRKLK